MKPMAMFPVAPPLRDDVDQAPLTQQVEAAPGEIDLDAVVRAQSNAPQVVERLTTLEDCLWAAVDALGKLSPKTREVLGADAIIDRAKFLLRGDLEISEKQQLEEAGETEISESRSTRLD
jgi:predicted CoA-binding protein